jgi:hypothetical protein
MKKKMLNFWFICFSIMLLDNITYGTSTIIGTVYVNDYALEGFPRRDVVGLYRYS